MIASTDVPTLVPRTEPSPPPSAPSAPPAPPAHLPLTDAPAVLAVDRASVRFGKLRAVRSVSFTLNGGDLLGLIGPNGAGKTTLLRAICGLQPLSAGVVNLLGEPLTPDRTDLLAHVGFT